MTEESVLGLDIGTATTKAVLARPDGTVIATAQRPHTVSSPHPGWAEHDAALEQQLGADAILARGGSALSSQAVGPRLLWIRRHGRRVSKPHLFHSLEPNSYEAEVDT
jgi:sugar (pentulose or hexulose) kinase